MISEIYCEFLLEYVKECNIFLYSFIYKDDYKLCCETCMTSLLFDSISAAQINSFSKRAFNALYTTVI